MLDWLELEENVLPEGSVEEKEDYIPVRGSIVR